MKLIKSHLKTSLGLLDALQPPTSYLQRVRTESSGLQADSYRAAAPGPPQQHDGGLKEKVHGMALRLHGYKQQRAKAAVATQRSRRGPAPLRVATFRAAKHEPVAAARAVDRRWAHSVQPRPLGPLPPSRPVEFTPTGMR